MQEIWYNWRLSCVKQTGLRITKHYTFSIICGSYVYLKLIIYWEFHNLTLTSLSSLHRLLFSLSGL